MSRNHFSNRCANCNEELDVDEGRWIRPTNFADYKLLCYSCTKHASVAERMNAPGCRSGPYVVNIVGSNPTASTK